eukprot:14667961-Alexandrium_andersonii.AAC.1
MEKDTAENITEARKYDAKEQPVWFPLVKLCTGTRKQRVQLYMDSLAWRATRGQVTACDISQDPRQRYRAASHVPFLARSSE